MKITTTFDSKWIPMQIKEDVYFQGAILSPSSFSLLGRFSLSYKNTSTSHFFLSFISSPILHQICRSCFTQSEGKMVILNPPLPLDYVLSYCFRCVIIIMHNGNTIESKRMINDLLFDHRVIASFSFTRLCLWIGGVVKKSCDIKCIMGGENVCVCQ